MTGGIIALGMGVKDLRLTDLMVQFKRIATETFKKNRAPKYRVTQTIAEKMQKVLGDRNLLSR